jgi:hypothetical protein
MDFKLDSKLSEMEILAQPLCETVNFYSHKIKTLQELRPGDSERRLEQFE